MKSLEFYGLENEKGPVENYTERNEMDESIDIMHKIGERLLDLRLDYDFKFNFDKPNEKVKIFISGDKSWEIKGNEISLVAKQVKEVLEENLANFDISKMVVDKDDNEKWFISYELD